jgi:hypothetical protein
MASRTVTSANGRKGPLGFRVCFSEISAFAGANPIGSPRVGRAGRALSSACRPVAAGTRAQSCVAPSASIQRASVIGPAQAGPCAYRALRPWPIRLPWFPPRPFGLGARVVSSGTSARSLRRAEVPAVPPNPAVNTDAPSAALRAGRGSPVTLIR